MDNERELKQIVEPSTGSSVILDPPEPTSEEIAEPKKHRAQLDKRRWGAMPKKLKLRILIIALMVFVIIAGVATAVVIWRSKQIHYGETYREAKVMRVKIMALKSEYACQKVLDYVNSSYTTMAVFTEYTEGCKMSGEDLRGPMEALALTEGVRKDDEVRAKYDSFRAVYDETMQHGEDLSGTLELYTVWHQFIVAEASVDGWDQTDADLTAVAKVLTDSGDELLVQYGKEWLAKRLAAAAAYREYYEASFTARNKEELRLDMEAKQKDFNDFQAAKRPNIKEVQVLKTADTGKLYTRFEDFYNVVRTKYQAHYDKDSGDCKALLTEVVCD